ncbi:MAG: NAD(+) synthase [bacterium]|nr:NAD(+) synthase [bacterium]
MTEIITMKKLAGLKIGICQMPVTPGRPDINTEYIVREIAAAEKRGVDIVVFPELCVPGYLIGDMFEDESFVRDVLACNEEIRQATRSGIIAIFGSLAADPDKKGEDGRLRIMNSGCTVQSGSWIHRTEKFLQPNYRFFDDDRHFFSLRKSVGEDLEQQRRMTVAGALNRYDIRDYFRTCRLETSMGNIAAGIMLCEDMWHDDYAYNPAAYLVERGAQILFNLSASPWGWQKNRKRHAVVKKLLADCPVPFVYVNNTGLQNNGKNLIGFDGSSAVYRPDGEIVFEVSPYEGGTRDIELADAMPPLIAKTQNDTEELYLAVRNCIRCFFGEGDTRKVFIGLSGGIDSSLAAALYADALGADRVVGVHMPFVYTQEDSTSLAAEVAKNLGISHQTRPIGDIVGAICSQTAISPDDDLAYQNVQARARMEILAAMAQKNGGLFTANWNKVEAAFGYGTLYADVAGALAVLGDMVKREEYQLAEYINRVVFGRQVIPQACFDKKPTAELKNAQVDPFDYGSLARRGYHDEMVRAFTEFRKNPEWFLECYGNGTLETELMLEPMTLVKLFPTAHAFIEDLERHWQLLHRSYFKRVQSPPSTVTSKRSFGYDLRESMLSPYFTRRYKRLKEELLHHAVS